MGVYVRVELKDLKDLNQRMVNFERLDNRCEVNYCDYCGGAGCYVPDQELEVYIPPLGWVRSYSNFALLFDNKNVNFEIVEALDNLGIPYVRG